MPGWWVGKKEEWKGCAAPGAEESKELQEPFSVMMNMTALLVGMYHIGMGKASELFFFSPIFVSYNLGRKELGM